MHPKEFMKCPSKFMDISERNLQNQDDIKKDEFGIWNYSGYLASHGNAKEEKPYYSTWPSTVKKIKKECLRQGSEVTVECPLSVAGDLTGASAPGQLPRDEKQETNMRKEAEGAMWAKFRTQNQAPYDLCIKHQEWLAAMHVF